MAKYANISLDNAMSFKAGIATAPLFDYNFVGYAQGVMFGSTVRTETAGQIYWGQSLEHAWVPGMIDHWIGLYHRFSVTVSAPGDSDTYQFYIWIEDEYTFGGGGYLPMAAAPFPVVDELAVEGAFDVSGIKYRGTMTETTPTDSGFLAWQDNRAYTATWYIDEDATFSVVATLPDGRIITKSGDFTEEGEYDIGANWSVSTSVGVNGLIDTDVIAPYITEWESNGEAVDTDLLDLYNPGTSVPDATTAPNWGRVPSHATRARVVDDGSGSGYGLMAEGAQIVVPISFTAKAWMPYNVTFDPRDGRFADH